MSLHHLRDALQYRTARALFGLPAPLQYALSGQRPVRRGRESLAADMQLLLSLRELLGPQDATLRDRDLPSARAQVRREAMAHAGPRVPVAATHDFRIAGPGGPLPVRHYATREAGPRPLLVYLHGGGFCVGDLETHDAPCRRLCRDAGVHVLAVDYRLAPEHPYPAAVDDARAAFAWAVEHAAGLGADPARVAVGGDSAGGNLAAVVALFAARDGLPAPALQLLIYPCTDRVRPFASLGEFGEGFFLTAADIEWYFDRYTAGTGVGREHPAISPLRASPLPKLCPALVVTAGCDPLRDEGDAYAAALAESGTPTEHLQLPGLLHGFINMTAVSPAASRGFRQMTGRLRALLG
jgi:acetyl esterase